MRSCRCDPGYTCCSENVPTGSPTFGMCVKSGFCDSERGIPKKGCSGTVQADSGDSVKILEFSHEGYDSDCSSWNKAMIIMVLIIVLLLALGVFLWKPRRS